MSTGLYYSSGEAARLLAISQAQLRALCEAKSVTASMTSGGQWRVPYEEVERLKAEGVPPAPRPMPMPDGTAPRRANGGRNGGELLGPPSVGLMGTAEKVVAAENLLRQRRLELELAEVEDRHRQHKERVASERAERNRQELELWRQNCREEEGRREVARQAEAQKRWRDRWIDHAVKSAAAAPAEYRLEAHDRVSALLDELSPTLDQATLESLVAAAVEEALRPWRHAQDRQRVIEDSLKRLPTWARNSATPIEWEKAVTDIVVEVTAALGEDATYEAMMAASSPAVDALLAACGHLARLNKVVRRLWLSADDERAVRTALGKMPVGSSEDEMERAAKGCLRRSAS